MIVFDYLWLSSSVVVVIDGYDLSGCNYSNKLVQHQGGVPSQSYSFPVMNALTQAGLQ
jgi:hypothetical protein